MIRGGPGTVQNPGGAGTGSVRLGGLAAVAEKESVSWGSSTHSGFGFVLSNPDFRFEKQIQYAVAKLYAEIICTGTFVCVANILSAAGAGGSRALARLARSSSAALVAPPRP